METTTGYSAGMLRSTTPNQFLCIMILFVLALSGCTKEGPAGPQGPPGSSEDHLSDPAIQPKVIFTYPSNNATGPFEVYNRSDEGNGLPHFTVRFNKLMRKSSVDAKTVTVQGFNRPVIVRIYTPIYYGPRRNTSKTSDNEFYSDLLSFRIQDSTGYYYSSPTSYLVGQSFVVTIDSTLEDINGNHLTQRVSFSFKPEPAFRILESYPENGTTDAAIWTIPSIVFNSVVDTGIFSSIQLSPNISGRWNLSSYDSAAATFQISQYLRFNTTYAFSVSTNAKDVYGNALLYPYSSSFSTTQFRVTSTFPSDGSSLVPLGDNINVNFSGFIDTSTIRLSFTINPPTNGFFYSDIPLYFRFFPTDELTPSTTYTITLSSALQAVDGTHLSSPYHFSFTTDRFRVSYTNPSDGSFNIPSSIWIVVNFNSLIDSGSVRAAFSISPSVSGVFSLYDVSSGFGFTPNNQLAANTLYTVTISTGLKTKNGYNLLTPYVFSFITAR